MRSHFVNGATAQPSASAVLTAKATASRLMTAMYQLPEIEMVPTDRLITNLAMTGVRDVQAARGLALLPEAELGIEQIGVEETALLQALKEGWIAGAGLDVYEREPEVHPSLLAAPSAVLLPHVGSATVETRE